MDIYRMADSIGKKENKNVLVNNIPHYYFIPKAEGLYYWCGDDIFYLEEKKISLLIHSDEVSTIGRFRKYGIGFILTSTENNKYSELFTSFLKKNTKKIAESKDGLLLYRLK